MKPRWPRRRRDGLVAIGTTVGGITVRLPKQQAASWSQVHDEVRESFLEDVDERAGLRQVCPRCRFATYDKRLIEVGWCTPCAANTIPAQRRARHRQED